MDSRTCQGNLGEFGLVKYSTDSKFCWWYWVARHYEMERAGVLRSRYGWIGHFTVVCLVTWPWIGSEAGGDLVLIQTSLVFICKCKLVSIRTAWSTYEKQWGLYQNTVTPSLASTPRPGHQAHNCKMGYYPEFFSGVNEATWDTQDWVW